jgi:cell wall-associated NlpC family hydrolase
LFAVGRPVPTSRLRPGDLVFFDGLGHVGIYVGRGRMIHAPQSGERVSVDTIFRSFGNRFVGARRLQRV